MAARLSVEGLDKRYGSVHAAAAVSAVLGLRIVDPKSRPQLDEDDESLWEEVEVDERGNVLRGDEEVDDVDEAVQRSMAAGPALASSGPGTAGPSSAERFPNETTRLLRK